MLCSEMSRARAKTGVTLDELLVNAATETLNVGGVHQKFAGPTHAVAKDGWRQHMRILEGSQGATYLQNGSSCAMASVTQS